MTQLSSGARVHITEHSGCLMLCLVPPEFSLDCHRGGKGQREAENLVRVTQQVADVDLGAGGGSMGLSVSLPSGPGGPEAFSLGSSHS